MSDEELRKMLTYRNPRVVQSIAEELNCSSAHAKTLFGALIKFLYLKAKYERPGVNFLPPPLIERVWKTFVIYTAAYREFCTKGGGEFIDYEPSEVSENPAVKARQVDRNEALLHRVRKEFGRVMYYWYLPPKCHNRKSRPVRVG